MLSYMEEYCLVCSLHLDSFNKSPIINIPQGGQQDQVDQADRRSCMSSKRSGYIMC